MEKGKGRLPRKITDEVVVECTHCKEAVYKESIIATLDGDDYTYERFVSGNFKQSCDKEGVPKGAVIPICDCKQRKEI